MSDGGFFSGLINRRSVQAMDLTLAFVSAKHRVIAENIANVDTPGYRARRLDGRLFQEALAEALERRGPRPDSPVRLPRTRQFVHQADGRVRFYPQERPLRNVMFHDGTTGRIEMEMKELAENQMMHQLVTTLLRGEYEGLLKAIRGTLA